MTRLAGIRIASAALALFVLAVFQFLHGELPWLGQFEWIGGVWQDSGLAWEARLHDPALDEDGHDLGAALFEWAPGPPSDSASWLCGLPGPAFGQAPDAVCGRYWHAFGPGRQLHKAIRNDGGGRFSVWHGFLYFSVPDRADPRSPGRRFALWAPWTGASRWGAALAAAALLWSAWPAMRAFARRRPSTFAAQLAWIRVVLAGPALLILSLFVLLRGELPWLGQYKWIDAIQADRGFAWTAPLDGPALDEDGHDLGAALFEWVPGAPSDSVSCLCGLGGPAFAQTPDAVCGRYWHSLGPGRQPHETMRTEGGGRFSVWHGFLLFSTPDGTDPRVLGRHFALWVPWTGASSWCAALALIALLWFASPAARGLASHHPRVRLVLLGLIGCAALTARGETSVTLLCGILLLTALQVLPQDRSALQRRGWISALLFVLAGILVAETGLSAAFTSLGLVPNLQTMEMLKYLVDLDTDRPVVLLVGSSLSQYGVDETRLETALESAGHRVTVVRFGFGGMSIPERLYYLRRYLTTAKHRPAPVLFEVSEYYDLSPLLQLEQNPDSSREIAAMDWDNLDLSLEWVLGQEGDPSEWLTLIGELLGDFAIHELHVGFLPTSVWSTQLPANPYSGTPPKTVHFPDAWIAAELAKGQRSQTLSSAGLIGGAPTSIPTGWLERAIREEIGLFRAAGVVRFAFYAPPSGYAWEPTYARQFCRAMTAWPCITADDPNLITALGHDEDWLDRGHLQGPGRRLYTNWLASKVSASGMLP